MDKLLENIGMAALFSAFGVLLFTISFFMMAKMLTMFPQLMRKEIEEDQNTALAILMGSIVIGISIIVAAAVH